VCVHGHFYQPPRENPWLDAIDPQPSAAPYHDWNARVAAECYAPNTAARILDEMGRIQHIVNNYAHMSFNVGPTLMRWLAHHEPVTYAGIVAADKAGQMRFAGHGPAMAQVYGHLIIDAHKWHGG
jgi:alpha-amylase/alpha-mannosidase (GH57 family)